eukprot:COSAG05_NODE_345_length_10977_cov_17.229178_10_plen_67_part_00
MSAVGVRHTRVYFSYSAGYDPQIIRLASERMIRVSEYRYRLYRYYSTTGTGTAVQVPVPVLGPNFP